MQVIKIRHPFNPTKIPAGKVVLAMGFFDGVHRGHQAVINRAQEIAASKHLPLAVLTYDHHPAIVYQSSAAPLTYLSPLPRKLALLQQLGVDIVYVVSFTSALSALSPQDFVDQYIVGFHTEVAVAGFDHTYGPAKIATMTQLPQYAKGRFTIETLPCQQQNAQKISSTKIRTLLDHGDIKQANQLLNYHYQTSGLVVHGEARGRTLGFPTANIQWPVDERVPNVGVYAVLLKVGDQWYRGMASIGFNVTFGDQRPKTLEIYLLDFNQAIYGENVLVKWVKRLRDEVKYTTAAALVAQLQQDEIDTRNVFSQFEDLYSLN